MAEGRVDVSPVEEMRTGISTTYLYYTSTVATQSLNLPEMSGFMCLSYKPTKRSHRLDKTRFV